MKEVEMRMAPNQEEEYMTQKRRVGVDEEKES